MLPGGKPSRNLRISRLSLTFRLLLEQPYLTYFILHFRSCQDPDLFATSKRVPEGCPDQNAFPRLPKTHLTTSPPSDIQTSSWWLHRTLQFRRLCLGCILRRFARPLSRILTVCEGFRSRYLVWTPLGGCGVWQGRKCWNLSQERSFMFSPGISCGHRNC